MDNTTRNQKTWPFILLTFLLFGSVVIVSLFSQTLAAILAIVFVAFIALVIFSSRWVLTNDAICSTSFFSRVTYPLASIRKIYVARVPTDTSFMSSTVRWAGTATSFIGRKMQQVVPQSPEALRSLAETMAPPQLWFDLDDGQGGVRSQPIAQNSRSSVTAKLGQLTAALRQAETRLPAGTISQDVWSYLGEGPEGRVIQRFRFASTFAFVAGVVSLTFGAWVAVRTIQFLSMAESVEAIVVGYEMKKRPSDERPTFFPEFSFLAVNGRTYSVRSNAGGPDKPFAIGSRLIALYDPADPEKARLKRFTSLWMPIVIPLGIGIVGMFLGVVGRRRRPVTGNDK